jgi:two-component system, OmpR family, sensor kinase
VTGIHKMTLRNRLAVSMAIISVALVVGSLLAVTSQRRFLIGRIDGALSAIRPSALLAADGQTAAAPALDTNPISEFYAAVVEPDGDQRVLVRGSVPSDTPDLSSVDTSALQPGEAVTTAGQRSDTEFRLMEVTEFSDGSVAIVAVRLDEVNEAVRRLVIIHTVLVALVLLTMSLVFYWVLRLGLRPIAALTKVADTMTDSGRSQRVQIADDFTEAGRLGRAFNFMLDQRDDSEERLRTFMADASHELRTPLTSIRGLLGVFADGGFTTDAERNDAHRRMHKETARMQRLIEDLLLLAKIDGDVPLHCQPVPVTRLVADLAADAQLLHPARVIATSVPTDDDLTITADRSRLEQVLVALLDNALAHTPPECRIELVARRDDASVSVHVRDDGPGLTAEVAARVFDRFFRFDHARTRRSAAGSGLGLAISRALIESHGGSITLVTEVGSGCDFEIRLPLTAEDQRAADAREG